MTILKNTRNGMALKPWAWVLALIWTVCLSFVLTCLSPAFAASEPFEQTLHVKQSVSGDPQRTQYTYELTPITKNAPLPADAKEGAETYDFVMDGDAKVDLKLYFPSDVKADYKYELRRVEAAPAGDTVTPDVHIFGYLVETDENGEWIIIPYTCYNNEFKISTDKDGNPTDVTLEENKIVGKDKSTTSTTKSTTKSTTGTTKRSNTTNRYSTRTATQTNVVTRTVTRVVNTGDPYQVGLWVVLLVLSLAAMIIVAAIRRKNENDEENR